MKQIVKDSSMIVVTLGTLISTNKLDYAGYTTPAGVKYYLTESDGTAGFLAYNDTNSTEDKNYERLSKVVAIESAMRNHKVYSFDTFYELTQWLTEK